MSQRLLALTLVTLLSSLTSVAAQRAVVTGTITYRERIALPPTAMVEVTLEDVSRPDRPADVLARVRQSLPSQPPVPFEVAFDQRRINPRSRYAVRARIVDGERVLFATTDTVLVLTQGRGSQASLLLRMVAPAESAGRGGASDGAFRAPAPVVELRNLPATFAGTITCEGCQPTRYDLNLFTDDSFYLRKTTLGRPARMEDDLGSYALSSDRRAIMLRTSKGATEVFAIRDSSTLRRLDERGRELAGRQDLRRLSSFSPLVLTVTVGGAYAVTADGVRFVECSTGQSWFVADEGAGRELRSAGAPRTLGAARYITAAGRLVPRRRTDGAGTDTTFIVERTEPFGQNQGCAPRFAALPLVGTYWRLVSLGDNPVGTPAGARSEPSLTFRADQQSFGGSSGCNRLAGRYQAGGEQLVLTVAGTMMACPAGADVEAAFGKALTATRRYRILGTQLELYDDGQNVVARFEGRP